MDGRPGDELAGAVAADPFFAPVRRRHPDVHVVLLPPDTERPDAPFLSEAEFVAAVERDHRALDAVLPGVLGDLDLAVEQQPRWRAGTLPESVATRECRGAQGIEPAEASLLLARTDRVCRDRGWDVTGSGAGVPRVLATSPDRTVQLEVLHVAATGRVALVVRRGPYPVGADRVRALRSEDSR